jgi:hypothetical protein
LTPFERQYGLQNGLLAVSELSSYGEQGVVASKGAPGGGLDP